MIIHCNPWNWGGFQELSGRATRSSFNGGKSVHPLANDVTEKDLEKTERKLREDDREANLKHRRMNGVGNCWMYLDIVDYSGLAESPISCNGLDTCIPISMAMNEGIP